jgi:hypothetical protein
MDQALSECERRMRRARVMAHARDVVERFRHTIWTSRNGKVEIGPSAYRSVSLECGLECGPVSSSSFFTLVTSGTEIEAVAVLSWLGLSLGRSLSEPDRLMSLEPPLLAVVLRFLDLGLAMAILPFSTQTACRLRR